MNAQPDLSTLPQRMRYAAKVIEEANLRKGDGAVSWGMGGLEIHADRWEFEDRAADERDAEVDELARKMYSILEGPHALAWDCGASLYTQHRDRYLDLAQKLIQFGWRKEVSA